MEDMFRKMPSRVRCQVCAGIRLDPMPSPGSSNEFRFKCRRPDCEAITVVAVVYREDATVIVEAYRGQ